MKTRDGKRAARAPCVVPMKHSKSTPMPAPSPLSSSSAAAATVEPKYSLVASNIGNQHRQFKAMFPSGRQAAEAAWRICHQYELERNHHNWYVISETDKTEPSASASSSDATPVEMKPLYTITVNYNMWKWDPHTEFVQNVMRALESSDGSFIIVGGDGGHRDSAPSSRQGRLEVRRLSGQSSGPAPRRVQSSPLTTTDRRRRQPAGRNDQSDRRKDAGSPMLHNTPVTSSFMLPPSSSPAKCHTAHAPLRPGMGDDTVGTAETSSSSSSTVSSLSQPQAFQEHRSKSAKKRNQSSPSRPKVVVFLDKAAVASSSSSSSSSPLDKGVGTNGKKRASSARPLKIRTVADGLDQARTRPRPKPMPYLDTFCMSGTSSGRMGAAWYGRGCGALDDVQDEDCGRTTPHRRSAGRTEEGSVWSSFSGGEDDDSGLFSELENSLNGTDDCQSTTTSTVEMASVASTYEKEHSLLHGTGASSSYRRTLAGSRGFHLEEGMMRLFNCGVICHDLYSNTRSRKMGKEEHDEHLLMHFRTNYGKQRGQGTRRTRKIRHGFQEI